MGKMMWRATRMVGWIWEADPRAVSWWRGLGIRALRVVHLVIRGFRDDECPLHASALTFTTLLAIVPILAVAFWILRGSDAAGVAEQKVLDAVQGMPPQFESFVKDILTYVHNTNFATVGGVGLVLLLLVVIRVLGRVEGSFNRVWGVTVPRTWVRKAADYISLVVVAPVLVVAVTTMNATLSSERIVAMLGEHLGSATFLYHRALRLAPWVASWLVFALINMLLPNTRVRVVAATVGGLAGGTLWMVWQLVYIRLQVSLAGYNAIYGTFASVPIFLIWLFASWEIVLLSAEIAFGVQHSATYMREQEASNASAESRWLLALALLERAARSLRDGESPLDLEAFADERLVPVRLVGDVAQELADAGLLAPLSSDGRKYALLRSPDRVMTRDVFRLLFESGARPAALGLDGVRKSLRGAVEAAGRGLDQAMGDASLLQIMAEGEQRATPQCPENADGDDGDAS